jgi:HSP20 family molecular chaperone IbpA
MVVKVRLPGAQMKDLALDITDNRFLVRSAT